MQLANWPRLRVITLNYNSANFSPTPNNAGGHIRMQGRLLLQTISGAWCLASSSTSRHASSFSISFAPVRVSRVGSELAGRASIPQDWAVDIARYWSATRMASRYLGPPMSDSPLLMIHMSSRSALRDFKRGVRSVYANHTTVDYIRGTRASTSNGGSTTKTGKLVHTMTVRQYVLCPDSTADTRGPR